MSDVIRFELDFGSNVTLTSAIYVLTGPSSFRRVGSLPVGDSTTITATFDNLPPGQGYVLSVRATASDDVDNCQGRVTFDVTASMTATIQVPLTCTGIASVAGNVVNTCPVVDNLTAIPAEVNLGSSIHLTSLVHDPDNAPAPLTASWSAAGGMLSDTSTAGAVFTCTAPGTFDVVLQLSDGGGAANCPDTATVTIRCTVAPQALLQPTSGASAGKGVV